jgi:hypothetical protein
MNGFTPDRKPQQMARMLAMQERNLSLNSPGNNMRNVPQPNLMYAGATPNTNPGVPPQAMNFNGPPQAMQGGRPLGYGPPLSSRGQPQMGPPRSPQVGGMMQRPRMPAPAGMTTPQGGSYRGDFENAG